MPKDLHSFLAEYEASYPNDVLHIDREINSDQEITAIVYLAPSQHFYGKE